MSVVADQVRQLDAQLDRIPFNHLTSHDAEINYLAASAQMSSPRVKELLRIIKTLSTPPATHPILPEWKLSSLLAEAQLGTEGVNVSATNQYEAELEWLLVSKATVQTYGIIMNTLLDQIIPLSDHIWYWDDVLSSQTYSSLYMAQTSPINFWRWTQDIYQDSKSRLRRGMSGTAAATGNPGNASLSHRWRHFYFIVQESIRERSLADIQQHFMSPLAMCRSEVRQKQAQLKKLREMTSSGLGVLIGEGLAFGGNGSDDGKSDIIMSANQDWKGVVERSVVLIDMVLRDVLMLQTTTSEFEDRVFAGVEEDPELSIQVEEDESNRAVLIARRIQTILETQLPEHLKAAEKLVAENGRPSKLTRYWLPAVVLLVSSTTILRIFFNRRQEILDWIADFAATIRDFWLNWIVEPTKKIIGTIRHDANSEIAIMSRDSLKADRESLERMVVDFAIDNPAAAAGTSSLSESQVADIRAKVKEGDVTPVLRAYEHDLRRPLKGAIRGDLVRTLLIQVQKTKVDVEVAMAGIDSLLKSQELVFGFVGLTPGIFVSIGFVQYLRSVFQGRKSFRQGRKGGKCMRTLRNIDRILSEAMLLPIENNVLSYKDHGLLVCEVHVLRRLAHKLLPHDVEKDFLEDLDDLANMKGVSLQARAMDRIRWAYSKWLR